MKHNISYFPIYLTLPYLIISLLYLKIDSFRYICFALMALFLAGFLLSGKKVYFKIKYIYLLIFLLLFSVASLVASDLVTIIKNELMIILNFAPIFIFDFFYSRRVDSNQGGYAKVFLKFIIPILVYTVVATLYYLYTNPYVARYMASWDPSVEANPALPIAIGGGYALIYGIIFMPPVFVYFIKNIPCTLREKIKYLLLAIFILYFIIQSGFATAFLISLIGVFLVLITKKNTSNTLKVSLIFISIIMLMLIFNSNVLYSILDFLEIFLPKDSIVVVRLNEIIPVLINGDRSCSFGMRIGGLQKTLDAFKSSPLFGVGYKVGYVYMQEAAFLGLHTEWLESLGRYGIIIGFPYFAFLYLSFKDLIKKYENVDYKMLMKILFCLVIILGFCNPFMTSSAFIFLFVIIPSMINLKIHKFE